MTLSITVDTAGQLRSELDGHPVTDDELHLDRPGRQAGPDQPQPTPHRLTHG